MMATDKVAIVTGSNCGIGFEACKLLCRDGYDVILACRNETATSEAIQKLKSIDSNSKASFMKVDLQDLDSVRQFVNDFHQTGKQLHVLVNNAGVFYQNNTRHVSEDGFEMTMATNHLGHFLLSRLLEEDLKKTAAECGEARIVVVASDVHNEVNANRMPGPDVVPMNFDDIHLEIDGAYTAIQAYKNSKTAQIMFARELARRLQGTGVTVNAMCPGITGKYYSSGRETDPSLESQDESSQKRMWELSEKLTGLK